MATHADNLKIAIDALAKGLVAIPCRSGTKIPMVKWKEWQDKMPTQDLIREWFRMNCNIAIITTEMVVFDCDDPAKAKKVIQECGDTPVKVQTPRRGIHLQYRLRQGTKIGNHVRILKTKENPEGEPIDIRTNGGLEMIPTSQTENGRYEWLGEGLKAVSELPVANIGWTRTRVQKRVIAVVPDHCGGNVLLFRGERYIDKFDKRAVSGQGGHTTFFVAALKIVSFVRKLGGKESDAWQLLLYYNASKCDPPWDVTNPNEERALKHKFEDALKMAR